MMEGLIIEIEAIFKKHGIYYTYEAQPNHS